MKVTLEKVKDLFKSGQFLDICKSVGSDLSSLKLVPSDVRVLIAHASVYAGSDQVASALAQSVIRDKVAPAVVAHAYIVSGLLNRRDGDIDRAASDFRNAVRLAREDRATAQLAWAHTHLFRLLALAGYPQSHVSALLNDTRRYVSISGDAHAMAYLHDSVATMEAQRGDVAEAERHLRLARGLLALRPSAWLSEILAVNASCVAAINCDSEGYIRNFSEARAFTRLSGNVSLSTAIDANEAHVAVLTGHFGRAANLIEKILNSPRTIENELGARESLARMHLAMGQLDSCEMALARVKAHRSSGALGFSLRGAAVLEVRLLIRRGDYAAAVTVAESYIQELEEVNDKSALVALIVSKALALANSGNISACARELLAASHFGAASMRSLQADYAHVCGLILNHISCSAFPAFESRGFRVWAAHGSVCGPLTAVTAKGYAATDDASAKRLLREHAPKADGHIPDLSERLKLSINHLATAFDVAYRPELIGEELAQAIRASELSTRVEILRAPSTANAGSSIVLRATSDKPLALTCEPPDDPFKAILLSDILRIGKAALELERAREAERSRAALWPADPVEDQGDAIFLAEEMQSLLATVRRIATTTVPVLITGETGTGKEVLARTIHACSNRAAATFLPFNCASTPKDMLDSQLFGHRRGAFTGAVEHFQGVIRAAAGGTLFLDEIGDTGLDVQPKLLRFLEAGEVHPIGETQPARVDVRVIAATNADLEGLVRDGRFREDLFYRLGIVRLHLPPLRERRVEIPSLANHYLRKHAIEYRKGDLRLSEDAMEYLMLYRWPGNVRQLANEMRRLAALAETSAVLMPEHLSPEITASRRTVPASQRTLESTEVVVRLDQPMAAAVRHLEQTMLQYALKKCEGRIEDTAAMLGLSRKGLYLKRQRFGIEPPESAAISA
jgi:DNA-binding NtrC family response regulator